MDRLDREARDAGTGAPDDRRVGQLLAGRYRLLRTLGAGQMATVYVAEQLSMGRNVAIKVLHDEVACEREAIGRFRQEVKAVSQLRSPHTIQFYDAGPTERGAPYIAMELLVGETLRQRLDRETSIPAHEVVTIAAQIGASLEEAHDAGILHRDLKPENIFLCAHPAGAGPFVKVLDFGLAKIVAADGDDLRLTGEGQTVGTPAYMAPEMIVQQRVVDHRADIYALGVMCFEMLTGQRPFQARTPLQMAMAHLTQPIPRATALADFLPAATDVAFEIAMAKDAARRSPQATSVAALLAQAFAA